MSAHRSSAWFEQHGRETKAGTIAAWLRQHGHRSTDAHRWHQDRRQRAAVEAGFQRGCSDRSWALALRILERVEADHGELTISQPELPGLEGAA